MGKFHTDYTLKAAPSNDDYILICDASTGEVMKIRVADISQTAHHTHLMSDITGLNAALANKADANHTHAAATLTPAIASLRTDAIEEGNYKFVTSDAVYTAIRRARSQTATLEAITAMQELVATSPTMEAAQLLYAAHFESNDDGDVTYSAIIQEEDAQADESVMKQIYNAEFVQMVKKNKFI